MGKIGKRSQPRSQYFTVKRLLNPVTLQYEDLGAPVGISTDVTAFIAGTTDIAPTTLLPITLGTYYFLTDIILTNSDTASHTISFEDGFATATPGTPKGTYIISSGATAAINISAGITFGTWYLANLAVAGATNAVAAYDASGTASNPTVTISGYLG